MSITLSRFIMSSPDRKFINTSKIISDSIAEAIYNGLEDKVATENIAAGRVGKFKGDPKFAEAKAYADSEVSKRLPAAILQAEVELGPDREIRVQVNTRRYSA